MGGNKQLWNDIDGSFSLMMVRGIFTMLQANIEARK